MHNVPSMLYALYTKLPLALAGVVFIALGLVGCDSSSPSTDTVDVGFRTQSGTETTAGTQNSMISKADDSLVLTGENGNTLEITDLRLIVSDIELEGDGDDDDGDDSDGDDNDAEFEMEKPLFLDLALNGDVTQAVAQTVPPGTYNEFDFEVDDVDLDDSDDDESVIQTLHDEIKEEFDNWPEDASMVVVGTFTPDGGEARAFTTYFEAELEVERTLEPPFEVTDEGTSRNLTVPLTPGQWFTNSDGSVRDLSQDDYSNTGTVVEFEVEFEDGVAEIEFDDD